MELRYYQTSLGERPFVDWFEGLNDKQARARIDARMARIAGGNLGDVEPVGEGVLELRIDWGPGHRRDKKIQQKDIKRAKVYFEDFKARSAKKERGA